MSVHNGANYPGNRICVQCDLIKALKASKSHIQEVGRSCIHTQTDRGSREAGGVVFCSSSRFSDGNIPRVTIVRKLKCVDRITANNVSTIKFEQRSNSSNMHKNKFEPRSNSIKKHKISWEDCPQSTQHSAFTQPLAWENAPVLLLHAALPTGLQCSYLRSRLRIINPVQVYVNENNNYLRVPQLSVTAAFHADGESPLRPVHQPYFGRSQLADPVSAQHEFDRSSHGRTSARARHTSNVTLRCRRPTSQRLSIGREHCSRHVGNVLRRSHRQFTGPQCESGQTGEEIRPNFCSGHSQETKTGSSIQTRSMAEIQWQERAYLVCCMETDGHAVVYSCGRESPGRGTTDRRNGVEELDTAHASRKRQGRATTTRRADGTRCIKVQHDGSPRVVPPPGEGSNGHRHRWKSSTTFRRCTVRRPSRKVHCFSPQFKFHHLWGHRRGTEGSPNENHPGCHWCWPVGRMWNSPLSHANGRGERGLVLVRSEVSTTGGNSLGQDSATATLWHPPNSNLPSQVLETEEDRDPRGETDISDQQPENGRTRKISKEQQWQYTPACYKSSSKHGHARQIDLHNEVTLNYLCNLFYLLEFMQHTGKFVAFLGHKIKILFLFSNQKSYLNISGNISGIPCVTKPAQVRDLQTAERQQRGLRLARQPRSTAPRNGKSELASTSRSPCAGPAYGDDGGVDNGEEVKSNTVFNSCHVSIHRKICGGWKQCFQQLQRVVMSTVCKNG